MSQNFFYITASKNNWFKKKMFILKKMTEFIKIKLSTQDACEVTA